MTSQIRLSDVVGGGYDDFWNCKKRYRVLKGGKGSKKSTTTALNFIYRIMKYPQSNLLVVRAVMNTHRDSTFAQLKWAQEALGADRLWRNTVSPMEMTYLPTGQKIIFRGFDDVMKLASATSERGVLCWVWIEEAFEIGSEADFEKLDLSVPRGNVPEGLFKQTTLTFNPWSEHHWLKKRFFDTVSPEVDTYTTNYLINEFLDDTDKEVFLRMKAESPRKYAVAGLGEWGISDGLIYDNWQIKDFVMSAKGTPILCDGDDDENAWQYRSFFGLDYGYTNDPTAFTAFTANPIKKEVWIFDEHYERGMLNADIAAMIKRKGYAKERIRADAAEPKSNADLRRMGIVRITPSVKGKDSILHGIAAVSEYKLYVCPSCKNTIAELSGYCWKKDKAENGINMPDDKNNHLMDAIRYAFYDVAAFTPKKAEKPEQAHRAYGIMTNGIMPEDFSDGGLY